MTSTSRSPSGVALLVASLFTWAVVLAIGAFVFGYRSDLRKPLVIVGVMVCFLAGWLTLLMLRQRRIANQAQVNSASKESVDAVNEPGHASGEPSSSDDPDMGSPSN